MGELSMNDIYSIQDIRSIEQAAMPTPSSEWALMFTAGSAVANWIKSQYSTEICVLVFCGVGNNGGDGLVAAYLAQAAGYQVQVYLQGDPSKFSSTARIAYQNALDCAVQICPFTSEILLNLDQHYIGIDALLGIGYRGTLSEPLQDIIHQINKLSIPILAVDLPSGLDPETGCVNSIAIKATHTLTFIAAKPGLFLGQAKDYTGPVDIYSLNISPELYVPYSPVMTIADKLQTPHRSKLSHKGKFGHLAIIGGQEGMVGAVILAAEGAYRMGAGKVTIITQSSQAASAILSCLPEAMIQIWKPGDNLTALLEAKTMMILGPGLGQSEWSKALFSKAIDYPLPKLVDADGLNLLAQSPRKLTNTILTPHPLEAARLLGRVDVSDIQTHRLERILDLRARYGGVVILKGAHTLIATSDGRTWVCPFGNPKLATAGSGDILTGMIAGLYCGGMAWDEAAVQGVVWHGVYGDRAASRSPFPGILAGDILVYTRPKMKSRE